jgi:hypothetical protein
MYLPAQEGVSSEIAVVAANPPGKRRRRVGSAFDAAAAPPPDAECAHHTPLLDLLAEDNWLNVYAGKLAPGAPTIQARWPSEVTGGSG